MGWATKWGVILQFRFWQHSQGSLESCSHCFLMMFKSNVQSNSRADFPELHGFRCFFNKLPRSSNTFFSCLGLGRLFCEFGKKQIQMNPTQECSILYITLAIRLVMEIHSQHLVTFDISRLQSASKRCWESWQKAGGQSLHGLTFNLKQVRDTQDIPAPQPTATSCPPCFEHSYDGTGPPSACLEAQQLAAMKNNNHHQQQQKQQSPCPKLQPNQDTNQIQTPAHAYVEYLQYLYVSRIHCSLANGCRWCTMQKLQSQTDTLSSIRVAKLLRRWNTHTYIYNMYIYNIYIIYIYIYCICL